MRVALVVLLASCDPMLPPPPPVAPSPPLLLVPPPVIENHITNYVTEMNIELPAPEAPPPRMRAPAPRAPAMCACLDTATVPQRPTTTIDSCDRYLVQTEIAIRCETDDAGAIGRVVDTLELSRRQWRQAAAGPARENLIDSCDVAEHSLTSALAGVCRGSG
ncbi:MAG TPA: hypothetical protein VGG74_34965 [Kofleriaceae bacterium]|jgi:hypothetical protein